MKNFFLYLLFLLSFAIILSLGYLSTIGYETDRFNSLLEKKIISNVPNTKINLNKIKVKINIKNLSFFITTFQPQVQYHSKQININKINAFINLKSIFTGKPKIDNINIVSDEIEVKEIKEVAKYLKPSNAKKFFLNEVKEGEITFNLNLNLKDNIIKDYEVDGIVKNFYANTNIINLKKMSFIYSIKKNSGQVDNIRGKLNGFQINSGKVEFDNSTSLKIKGDLKSDLNLKKTEIDYLFKKALTQHFENLQISGKIQSLFNLNFDKTLKITDYNFEASGNIKKSEIKLKKPQKYLFINDEINNLSFEKTDFQINLNKDSKNLINIKGFYKINNNLFQNFDLTNSYGDNLQKISINGNFDNEINVPILNYSSKDKIVNIETKFETKKNRLNVIKFVLKEGKNKIDVNNLVLINNKLVKLDNISIKTFYKNKFNNDFNINLDKKINVSGSKYDASNLTKLLEQNNNSDFFQNISKEVSVNIKEISTNVSDIISNFNLIGYIDKGKFNKIVSKGEFKDDKYLDISIREEKNSKKKILEIYSDLPKPLLSNYKFFNGLSGGQLLLFSSYDSKNSNTNLTIENFKVKEAPGLVKLLSLADFGGMVDALSGDGLSFEKLEMSMEKNDQVLNLKELYAIGPSISILMEGYVEYKTGLVSLRGTMVPAKTLNRFLSKLPVVGDILIPKEIGEGLFGISFKMKGMPGKIKTTVNPIKTLTPRFIQKALKKPK